MSSSDGSSLTSFLFYTFFVYPSTSYILKPRPSIPRSRAIIYAISFLLALAALKTGLEITERGGNHYTKLGVTRNSTPMEIKKAYKKLSLSLHPDKNPSPTAADDFASVKVRGGGRSAGRGEEGNGNNLETFFSTLVL